MGAILLALGAAVSWGVSDFMGGYFTRRLALVPVLLISQAVGFGMLLLLACLRGPPVLDGLAIALAMAASAAGLVGVAAVLASLFPVVTVLLARVVLHERLSRTQAAGVVCALSGVALIAAS